MMAVEYDLAIDQGATFYINFVYEDESGNAVDLTGYTAAMQFRESYSSAAATVSLTSPSGGIVITAATGTISVTVSAANTALLTAQTYVYDLEITDGAGVVTRVVQGKALIAFQATK
jgi:hypothetical protein